MIGQGLGMVAGGRRHDPALALYGGPDGLTLPAALAARAAHLLRAGGVLVMEHGELQGPALLRRLAATGDWRAATDHADLTGRRGTTHPEARGG